MKRVAALAISLTVFACSSSNAVENHDVGEAEVNARNLTANDFGLKDKEIVLTLDDGPGPRTVELAEFLALNNVPAVFFMVGKNAKANPEAVKRVATLSEQSGGNLIIGNHSMTHTTPLPKQGVDGSINEMMGADAVLAPHIQRSQGGLPTARSFFRPPYGAFTSLGTTNISRVNAAGAEKYTGPVFWDIGGELNERYSADWACWGKVSMARCADGYITEAQVRKKGIMLLHDVHSKTVDMLMGTGSANGRSLIKDLRNQGFKFVGLRHHEEAIVRFHEEQARLRASTTVSIDAAVETAEGGRVVVDVKTTNAAKVVAQFDNVMTNAIEFAGNKKLDVTLAPGSHYVVITAFDAAGVAQGQERYTFVVPAPISRDSDEGRNDGGAQCVNFDLMREGQLYRLYHGEVPCDSPGAFNPPFVLECYKYKGVLRTTRDPMLVGASEWSIEFDLSYQSDPNDKSKIGFVMDARDGDLHTATRFARGVRRPDVPMSLESVDCRHGEWRGMFHYPTGGSEKFLFRMVRNPQTGGRIEYQE